MNIIDKISTYFGNRELGGVRSNGWSKFRKEMLKKTPYCEICGTRWGLEAHHKKLFNDFPELELEESNIRILCRRHHLEWGHLFFFKRGNPELDKDIERIKTK